MAGAFCYATLSVEPDDQLKVRATPYQDGSRNDRHMLTIGVSVHDVTIFATMAQIGEIADKINAYLQDIRVTTTEEANHG